LLKKGLWTAAVWTYIFRKDLVLKSGAIFTDRKVHEDHLFTLRLLAGSEKISICNSELYFQNVTSGSLTKSPKKIDYLTERYKSYKEAREDIIYKFSQESIVLYDRWSMSSLLQILTENKKMVFQGIMHTAIYRVLWKEKLVILDFVKSKVKKKITRSKSLSQ
ncbi:TPA: glycosyltransferase family 2 protein, partial [Klebsiella pneumoniae]|nr:glycosyltransferase family 2 protein [Klebsiella pneumoniae]